MRTSAPASRASCSAASSPSSPAESGTIPCITPTHRSRMALENIGCSRGCCSAAQSVSAAWCGCSLLNPASAVFQNTIRPTIQPRYEHLLACAQLCSVKAPNLWCTCAHRHLRQTAPAPSSMQKGICLTLCNIQTDVKPHSPSPWWRRQRQQQPPAAWADWRRGWRLAAGAALPDLTPRPPLTAPPHAAPRAPVKHEAARSSLRGCESTVRRLLLYMCRRTAGPLRPPVNGGSRQAGSCLTPGHV